MPAVSPRRIHPARPPTCAHRSRLLLFLKRCRLNRYCMPKHAAPRGGPIVALLATVHHRTRRKSRTRMVVSGVGRKARPTVRGRTAGPHGHALRGAVHRHCPQSTEPRRRAGVGQHSRVVRDRHVCTGSGFSAPASDSNRIFHCAGSRWFPPSKRERGRGPGLAAALAQGRSRLRRHETLPTAGHDKTNARRAGHRCRPASRRGHRGVQRRGR